MKFQKLVFRIDFANFQWYDWSFERKTYTWSSPKSSHSIKSGGFHLKSGGCQVKSTQNLIKSDVSTKTLQFGGVHGGGAMTPDFMKSKAIAPLLHSSNWIVFVETSDFIRFWVDFTWNPPDFERPLARNCNPMFICTLSFTWVVRPLLQIFIYVYIFLNVLIQFVKSVQNSKNNLISLEIESTVMLHTCKVMRLCHINNSKVLSSNECNKISSFQTGLLHGLHL